MSEQFEISATIVIYKDKLNILQKTVDSFLKIPLKKKLFLVDNSPTNVLEKEFIDPEIEYKFVNRNIGFGSGHNLVLKKIKNYSKYHLILNPDVEFDTEVISILIKRIEKYENVAMIAPRVIYPNGKHQHTCRKYPTPLEMVSRRLKVFKNYTKKMEYRDVDLTKPFYPDFLQGCFQLFKTEDFIKINGFDELYFLYMEDVDICRKIDTIGKKKMYYPNEQITHILKKESSKNVRLFFIHFISSIKYFKKWGF